MVYVDTEVITIYIICILFSQTYAHNRGHRTFIYAMIYRIMLDLVRFSIWSWFACVFWRDDRNGSNSTRWHVFKQQDAVFVPKTSARVCQPGVLRSTRRLLLLVLVL